MSCSNTICSRICCCMRALVAMRPQSPSLWADAGCQYATLATRLQLLMMLYSDTDGIALCATAQQVGLPATEDRDVLSEAATNASLAPMEMPTSAAASAGKSLMPSPQKIVLLPSPCSARKLHSWGTSSDVMCYRHPTELWNQTKCCSDPAEQKPTEL